MIWGPDLAFVRVTLRVLGNHEVLWVKTVSCSNSLSRLLPLQCNFEGAVSTVQVKVLSVGLEELTCATRAGFSWQGGGAAHH